MKEADTLSMYERVMGREAFATLPRAVQRFHRLAGRVTLHGQVQVDAPSSLLARLLAFGLGAPQRAGRGPIRFELVAGSASETWTRHFPRRTMSSRMSLSAGMVEERLGLARLTFELVARDAGLTMVLRRLRVLGVPCPAGWLPRITADESGDGDRLTFDVAAAWPWIGTVARYRGHLGLGPEAAP